VRPMISTGASALSESDDVAGGAGASRSRRPLPFSVTCPETVGLSVAVAEGAM